MAGTSVGARGETAVDIGGFRHSGREALCITFAGGAGEGERKPHMRCRPGAPAGTHNHRRLVLITVIPGWSEGPDPESRDPGLDAEPVIGRAFARPVGIAPG